MDPSPPPPSVSARFLRWFDAACGVFRSLWAFVVVAACYLCSAVSALFTLRAFFSGPTDPDKASIIVVPILFGFAGPTVVFAVMGLALQLSYGVLREIERRN